jgi:hypothetical protein
MSQAPERKLKAGVEQVFITKPIEILDEKRVFVIPPKIHIGGKDSPKEILWVNQTGGPITIWIPNGGQYLNKYEDPDTHEVHEFIKPFPLDATGKLHVTVQASPPYGYYEYNVFCEVIKDYAHGESSPGVICP